MLADESSVACIKHFRNVQPVDSPSPTCFASMFTAGQLSPASGAVFSWLIEAELDVLAGLLPENVWLLDEKILGYTHS
jgi:hypothetical protein